MLEYSSVIIPPGQFLMGADIHDPQAFDNEKPLKSIHIATPLEMSIYPVTQGLYFDVTGERPGTTPVFERNYPVDNISWYEAIECCNRLSDINGYAYFYTVNGMEVFEQNTNGFRLPTEAEWEYACRAGTRTSYFFGDNDHDLKEYAWYEANSNNCIQLVGLKKPNPFGLFDMYGNVWEWCFDKYIHEPRFSDYAEKWPKLSKAALSIYENRTRVLRGGAFDMSSRTLRSSNRDVCGPGVKHKGNSFRMVRTLSPDKTP